MKYEFKVNGTVKLVIEPANNLEKELFKELFTGEVNVENVPNSDEILITKLPKIER